MIRHHVPLGDVLFPTARSANTFTHCIVWLPLIAGLLLIAFATAASATDTPPKPSAPDAAALQAATKLVRDVYATDIAAAKKPEDKIAFARKLLAVAAEEKTPAGRFAASTLARDLAADTGDIATAHSVIDQLDGQFQIDALKMKVDAATLAAKAMHKPDEKKNFVTLMIPVLDQAILADRYGPAAQLANLCSDVGGPQGAVPTRWVREAESAYALVPKAQLVLIDKSTDPPANLAVGKYRCFIQGDWEKGLPLLAQGGEPALEALAKKENAGVTSPDEQVTLADGWYDRVEKEASLTQRRLRKHAADWYSRALPQLSGLTKAKVEKHLSEIGAEGIFGSAAAVSPGGPKTIDLLALLDTSKCIVGGSWTLKEGVLISDMAPDARVQLPYHPPAEYDLHVTFSREQGNDLMYLVIAGGGKQFHWAMAGWGNSIMGFQRIDDMTADRNKSGVRISPAVENGKKYDVVIKVRKNGLAALVNGKQVTQWQTNYSDMTIHPNYALKDTQAIGLGTMGNIVKYAKIEVLEVTGQGELTKDHK